MSFLEKLVYLSKIECDKMIESEITIDGEVYYTNPITNMRIKKSGNTFRKIISQCDIINNTKTIIPTKKINYSNITKDIVNKWILNPSINPITNEKIALSFNSFNDLDKTSVYVKLYNNCYKFLKNEGNTNKEIKEILPKNHLLFNNIDLLYYRYNINEIYYKTHDNSDFNNNIIEKYYNNIENIIERYLKYDVNNEYLNILDIKKYNIYEKLIIINIINELSQCLNTYLSFISKILFTNYNNFNNYSRTIINNIEDINDTIIPFINFIKLDDKINKYIKKIIKDDHFELFITNKQYYNLKLKNILLQCNNIPLLIIDYLRELFKIVNFKNYPTNSPFDNLENKQFKEIEDPILKIIKDIGVDNIDVTTLELPKRSFTDDDEYNIYYSQYNKLKNSYEKKKEKWENTANNDITPPKRPTMILPNGKTINVTINKFPKYIKDNEYNTIVQTYKANEKTINKYKALIDVGILDLLKSPKTPPNTSPLNKLLNKDREYFENNVLDIGDNNKMKCNSNTDVISQDDFDDKKYLLAKLQLMYKLYTRNNNNEIIRTDCFYAPNFYNYIVSKVNNKETLINPITKLHITNEDVNRLMKIMKIVVPDIEKPVYLKPINDRELKINHITVLSKDDKPYYHIYISRKLGHVTPLIYSVCYIPADIEVSETGSTDIASTVFLFSIYKLFDEGKLLNTYMPPYYILDNDGNRDYIKPLIHFNNYETIDNWENKDREEVIRMFKHYLEEVKNYL